MFEDYFKTPLLRRFVCVEFRILAFKLLHHGYVSDGTLWLNLFTSFISVHIILICSFMIFILYSRASISFNSCESDEKLSILVRKMCGGLAILPILTVILALSSSSSSSSKELVRSTSLLRWYLFIFGCFRNVDITVLFR
jgi:hypothetical protein